MTEFEMSEDDLAELMDAMKPVPLIMLQCGMPPSQQERANSAWGLLGAKMGFDPISVKPSRANQPRFFYARSLLAEMGDMP